MIQVYVCESLHGDDDWDIEWVVERVFEGEDMALLWESEAPSYRRVTTMELE